jgi:hypothetical protein
MCDTITGGNEMDKLKLEELELEGKWVNKSDGYYYYVGEEEVGWIFKDCDNGHWVEFASSPHLDHNFSHQFQPLAESLYGKIDKLVSKLDHPLGRITIKHPTELPVFDEANALEETTGE